MKKIIASLFGAAMLLIGSQAYAQVVIGAGYLHAIDHTHNSSDGKAVGNPEHLNGFYVGAGYTVRMGEYFGFTPGLYVDMLFQGAQWSKGINDGYLISAAATYHYTELDINVPLNFNFNIDLGDIANFFVYAGPTFQYGAMASSTASADFSIAGVRRGAGESFDHYGKDGDANPFNILLGGGIGIGVSHFQLNAGYEHTLLNMCRAEGYGRGRHQIKVGISVSF